MHGLVERLNKLIEDHKEAAQCHSEEAVRLRSAAMEEQVMANRHRRIIKEIEDAIDPKPQPADLDSSD